MGTRRRFRWGRLGLVLLVLLVVALVALRVALPGLVRDYVNRKLSEIPDYSARVGDVDIHLWRGAYSIHDTRVVKTSGKIPVPFFSARTIDLSVSWRDLFDGALVGEIDLRRPKLNFVNGPTQETSQTSVDASWQDRVRELFPLRINRFQVHDGEVHYRDFHSQPKVDVAIDRVQAVARNLTNSKKISKTLAATISVDGRPFGHADLTLHSNVDPYQEKPTFDLAAELVQVDLTKFNDFARAYGGFDFGSGRLDVYIEVAAAKGKFTGYVKPLVTNLSIPNWKEEPENVWQRAWGVLVGVTAKLFRNHPKDRFATRIDYSGDFDNPKYSVWQVIVQVLKNTFVKAIPAKLEGDVSVGEAEREHGVNVKEADGTEVETKNTAADEVRKRVAEKRRRGEAIGPDESTDAEK